MRPYFASFLFFASSPFFYLFSIIRLDVPLKAHPLLSTYPHPVKDRFTGKPVRVEDNGFEPLTPCVQGRCSSQLS
jgi:hypothetical protein